MQNLARTQTSGASGKKPVDGIRWMKTTLEVVGLKKQSDSKITPPGLFSYLSHTVLPLRPHLFITLPTTFHHILPLAVIRADSNGKSDQVAGGRPTSPPPLLAPLLKSPWGPTRPLPASDSTRLGRIDRQPLVKLLKVVVIVIR